MEPGAVRLAYGGVPSRTRSSVALGLPLLCWVLTGGDAAGPDMAPTGRPSDGVIAVGRRSVLVSRGMIRAIGAGEVGVKGAARPVAQAACLLRGGATRGDLFIRFWTCRGSG